MKQLTYEQKLAEITRLEIDISRLEVSQGGKYGNLSPIISRLLGKLAKVRNSLTLCKPVCLSDEEFI